MQKTQMVNSDNLPVAFIQDGNVVLPNGKFAEAGVYYIEGVGKKTVTQAAMIQGEPPVNAQQSSAMEPEVIATVQHSRYEVNSTAVQPSATVTQATGRINTTADLKEAIQNLGKGAMVLPQEYTISGTGQKQNGLLLVYGEREFLLSNDFELVQNAEYINSSGQQARVESVQPAAVVAMQPSYTVNMTERGAGVGEVTSSADFLNRVALSRTNSGVRTP